MKRLGTILLACALILGMSQCKKENTNAGNGQVYIELKMENGQRADVTPSTGAYDYSDGDKLLVGYNGAYVGYLVYNAATNTFSNTLNITQSGAQPLHFYYLNGQLPTVTSGKCTVDISDQSAGLPVLAYAASRENFPSANGTYSAHLRNQCALVEFTTTGINADINIYGVNNKMTVDFTNAGARFTPSNKGGVKLFKDTNDNTKRYATLLSSEENATVYAYATDYFAEGISIPAISNNDYIHGENAIEVTLAAVDKRFSVSDYNKVYFSPGNLQATTTNKGTTWTWHFAEHQWDRVGNAAANTTINGPGTVSSNGTVDLFGWSTNSYYGINNSKNRNDYSGDFWEWGWLISSIWYTPSNAQWTYLFAHSTYGLATVNGVKGIILLPDGSKLSINTDHNAWNNNPIDASTWTGPYEAAGAVFLPASCYRYGSNINGPLLDYGYYWSSSPANANTSSVYMLYCSTTSVKSSQGSRYDGYHVRLVRNAN